MIEWLNSLKSPVKESIVFILVILLALVLNQIIHFVFKRLGLRQYMQVDKVGRTKKPVFFILIILFLKPAVKILGIGSEGFNQIIYVLLVFSCAWLIIQAISIGRELLLRHYDIEASDNLKARKISTQIRVFERVIIVLVVVLSIGLALMVFDQIRQVGISLLTSAGIAGIIVGLAAQKLIGNILAGMQIAITQPIRLDDVVIVENEWGRIEEITLTYVVVNIWDKRRLVVPSTYFIEKPFQNWTRTTAELLATVFVYVDYKTPIEPIREELTRILSETPLWDGNVNVLQVTDAKERSIELRALMSAQDSPTSWDLRVYVREKLITFLQANYPESLPKMRIEVDESKHNVESKAMPPQSNRT